ncbi:MAG: hypothetical protein KAI24_21340, partial [Planctomycetes bacterium]|nr:hypothetical protein [Planctomycetota bacterium]
MPTPPQPHPDRLAATLLQVLQEQPGGGRDGDGFRPPGPASANCRIDLKLLIHRAQQAMARSAAAREHLAPLDRERHPVLWAGTVPDGVARGFAARLEEACSLAPEPPRDAPDRDDEPDGVTIEGRDLRRKKDLLVASGGARARFTRKGGLLLVDRAHDVHSENGLWFEARRDLGTLDAFAPDIDERARLFSAQFLKPERYRAGERSTELVLAGSLGRGSARWPCRVTLRGATDATTLEITIE